MKIAKKAHLLVCLGLAFAFNSCDFGTSEYYTYSTNDGYNETYFSWGDSSRCGVIIYDTITKFDGLKLLFPADKSTVKGYCEIAYSPVRNAEDEIVDSVEKCVWHFNIPENDYRIKENSFAVLYMLNGNTIALVDTLFRKKKEITIIDRLPLPKLH